MPKHGVTLLLSPFDIDFDRPFLPELPCCLPVTRTPGLPRQQCLVPVFGYCLIWALDKLRMKAANLNTCLQCKSRQDLMNSGTFSFHLGLKSCLLLIFPGINSSPHLYLTWAAIWLPINSFTKGECVAPPNMDVRPPNSHLPAFSVACPACFACSVSDLSCLLNPPVPNLPILNRIRTASTTFLET